MIITTPTLVAIRRRMEEAAVPLLWHDVRTPARQARRIARVMRWMGYEGREASTAPVLGWPYTEPRDDGRKWQRGGRVR